MTAKRNRGYASGMDRLVRLERPVPDTSLDGAGSGSWVLVASIWAEIKDTLPSKGERTEAGFNVATRPARVRVRYRADITSDMRLVEGATQVDDVMDYSRARIMQIVSVPAELGRRERQEFMVEEYRPAGNAA
jgi:head-tail adaptor